jgi:hypothetical protein
MYFYQMLLHLNWEITLNYLGPAPEQALNRRVGPWADSAPAPGSVHTVRPRLRAEIGPFQPREIVGPGSALHSW